MIDLGNVIIHPDAEHAIQHANQTAQEFSDRFGLEDFGNIDAEAANCRVLQ